MVLLQNKDNTLPIKSTVTKIAVLGVSASYCAPMDSTGKATGPGITNCADDVNQGTVNFATGIRVGDVGSSRVDFDSSQAVGPCDGIKAAAGSGVTVNCGSNATDSTVTSADVIVVVAGLTPYDEGEEYNGSGDRTTLALDGTAALDGVGADIAAATLGVRRSLPEGYFIIIAEKPGVESSLTLDSYTETAKSNLNSAARSAKFVSDTRTKQNGMDVAVFETEAESVMTSGTPFSEALNAVNAACSLITRSVASLRLRPAR